MMYCAICLYGLNIGRCRIIVNFRNVLHHCRSANYSVLEGFSSAHVLDAVTVGCVWLNMLASSEFKVKAFNEGGILHTCIYPSTLPLYIRKHTQATSCSDLWDYSGAWCSNSVLQLSNITDIDLSAHLLYAQTLALDLMSITTASGWCNTVKSSLLWVRG